MFEHFVGAQLIFTADEKDKRMNLKDWEFIKCLKQGNDWLILHFKWIREAKSGKQEDARKKPTHSSTLAWQISWMEEPGRLQSMGSLKVGHDWATSLSLFTFMRWKGNGNSLQCSCLEKPRDGSAWWAAVYGVSQSWTRLKRLSSMANSLCCTAETDTAL